MAGALTGKKILIVEDEYFIATDLRRALREEDAVVVGPVRDVDRGLALATAEPLDAAVLDVNLEGANTYAIADRLTQRSVPYMFLTGYDDWALPEPYRTAPRVAKPFTVRAILTHVGRLLGAEAGL